MFLGFDDVINIMLAFLANKAPFFSAIFQIFCFFDSDQERLCYICNMYQK